MRHYTTDTDLNVINAAGETSAGPSESLLLL